MKDRLEKLAGLTRGAAIITLGVGAATPGCTKSEPSAQPTVAATSSAQASSADPQDASDGDAAPHFRRRFPIPNAMPPRWRLRDAGAGQADDGATKP